MKRINTADTDLARIASANTLTLTPNNRTASNLTNRVVNFKLEQTGKKACKLPDIYPLSQWVTAMFSQLRLQDIEPFNQLSIISDDAIISYWVTQLVNSGMESLTDRLPEILNADKFMSRWEVDEYTPDSELSQNFQKWRKAVHGQITANGYVTHSKALELIIKAVSDDVLNLPANVALFAFDEQPPLFKSLFDVISQKSNISEVNPIREETRWFSVPAESEEQELSYAARWASKIVEDDPAKTVAIVHPTLHANRSEVINALNEVFTPQWCLPGNTHVDAPYDVSIGVNLTDIHICKRALFYLEVQGNTVKSSSVAHIINDPWIMDGSVETKQGRRKFELTMRDNRQVKTDLLDLAKNSNCPVELSKKLSDFCFHNEVVPEFLLPSAWAQCFNDMLSKLEFAKNQKITVKSQNAIKKLNEVFDSFASLDAHTGEISRPLAINIICTLANKTQVTPEDKGSPISVLGALEASGLDFDYIWVLSCIQNTFPQAAAPNGFLPLALQVNLNMPHASVEREYEFAEKLFARFKTSCSTLIGSYAKQTDGMKLNKSFVLEGANEININAILDDDIIDFEEISFKRYSVEEKSESFPKITDKYLSGGVSLVDNASGCLMKAYYSNEMQIKEVAVNNKMGLTAVEKGNVTHNALEEIWPAIKEYRNEHGLSSDHEALCKMDTTELEQVIVKALASAMFWIDRNDISDQLLHAESKLIAKNIRESLDLDKERDPFNVVSQEQSKDVDLGGHRIKVRLDRVDDVAISGNKHKLLALDYKTSEESCSRAFSKSFKSQLPLSAIAVGASGVGYHNVLQNNCSISGLADQEKLEQFKPVSKHRYSGPKNWEELTHFWSEKISEVIQKYTSGNLSYTPSVDNCAYCIKRRTCPYSKNR